MASMKDDWRTIDQALRTIAQRRAALDADEARWLRAAEARKIWRHLGMVNALDYMERVLGYAPRAAQERLRVARALGGLPHLCDTLARGDLAFSAVRELTRVATPLTERVWASAAIGKNLREVEELVAGHRPGDTPDDPADPEVRNHVVRYELSPETYAVLRQARAVLDAEHGRYLDDDQVIAVFAHTVLDGKASTEPTGRARFQIATIVCERCRQGWQLGAGAKIAVGSAAVQRAECDAQHIGSIDHGAVSQRAYQDVAPAVQRLVWRRDHGRCQVPGCRSARGLELHHLVPREQGGSHEPSNLVLLCSACHQAHHDGRLKISGTAERLEVSRAHVGASEDGLEEARAHVGASEDDGLAEAPAHVGATDLRAKAEAALVELGWEPGVAGPAVDGALAECGASTLERLVFEALRRCPKPIG